MALELWVKGSFLSVFLLSFILSVSGADIDVMSSRFAIIKLWQNQCSYSYHTEYYLRFVAVIVVIALARRREHVETALAACVGIYIVCRRYRAHRYFRQFLSFLMALLS